MDDTDARLLEATDLLDFASPAMKGLVSDRNWRALDEYERIGAAYDFVRNEIAFGYNRADDIPASQVLAGGYGQCNTKATLLMALLRALDIPCRLHGFTIHKSLQRGVVPEIVYRIAPDNILHSWVEVLHGGRWVNLEGFILDDPYVASLQVACGGGGGSLCAFGAGTDRLMSPETDWKGEDTYIQRTGINADLGVFASPDDFYRNHRQQFGIVKELAYRSFIRHWMNRRVEKIRAGNVPHLPAEAAGTAPPIKRPGTTSAEFR